MYHGKVLCFNLHPVFGVDGNVEHPNSDYERAASLERHIPLAFETFKEPALEDSAPVATRLFCKITLAEILRFPIFQLPPL